MSSLRAQKKTEERLTRLEGVVDELAQAQKKTEERLTRLEGVVDELAQLKKELKRVSSPSKRLPKKLQQGMEVY
jgi:TolA-binding protein